MRSPNKRKEETEFLALLRPFLKGYEKAGPSLERWVVETKVGIFYSAGVRLPSPHL